LSALLFIEPNMVDSFIVYRNQYGCQLYCLKKPSWFSALLFLETKIVGRSIVYRN
jgi:hypothetical protein